MILAWAIVATLIAVPALVLLLLHAAGRGEDLARIEALERALAEERYFHSHWKQRAGGDVERMRTTGAI